MRVTGGSLGGRRIVAPRRRVRPTQDRVREALFSILGSRVSGCAFLDLFAGAGSVGIDACSRGAAHVVWVESGRSAVPVLRRNVRDICGGGTVIAADAFSFLRSGAHGEHFDIIFADPPYGLLTAPAKPPARAKRPPFLDAVAQSGALRPEGILVIEQAAHEPEPGSEGTWSLTDQRVYGDTCLRFYVER